MKPSNSSGSDEERTPTSAGPHSAPLDWAQRSGMADDVLQELEALGQARHRRRKTNLTRLGLAAILLLVGATAIVRFNHRPSAMKTLRVLSPAEKTLADGSVVQLKSGAEMAVDFSPAVRRVTLHHGTAHFRVAKNPDRPFVVTAGGLTVQAVGTQFSVDVGPRLIEVLVDEGRVEVTPRAPANNVGSPQRAMPDSALVDAAQQMVVVQDQLQKPGPPPVLTVTSVTPRAMQVMMAWRTPRFDFSGAALDQVVAAFNRHNSQQLVLEDPTLADLHISGTLRVDNITGLVQMLTQSFRVHAVHQGNRIILSRVPPPIGT